MSYDQSNGQCRCNGKKAIWKYKSTASTDFQATLKKGSPACFGNLMSLERSTCNFIYKSLHIWNQICFHLHFKALLVKSFLEKKTYMTQIVINKIPTSMTFMNDQKYLLVVLYDDQYIFVHRNRLSLENNSLHLRTSKGVTMLRTSPPQS